MLAQIRNLWTHDSTALEGNSLTLGETAFILEEGLTVQGKPLRDHNQVYGHAKAIELVYALLEEKGGILTKEHLFQLHKAVLAENVTDIYQPVGQWKNDRNFTSYVDGTGRQCWREYPAPKHIDAMMGQWLEDLNASMAESLDKEGAVSAYAGLHLGFVTVHPFFDGNGRMARLLANLPVLRSGFPPIVVPSTDRLSYNRALSAYQGTIPDLESLDDLGKMPENGEKGYFTGLCLDWWAETLALLEQAEDMAQKWKRTNPGGSTLSFL